MSIFNFNRNFRLVQKIVDFFSGSLSFYIGLILSPQFKFLAYADLEFKNYIFEGIVFGFFLSLSTFVVGQNARFITYSRIDYLVNSIVASVFGCVSSVVFLYVFQFSIVGRWVFALTIISHALFCFFVGLILNKYGSLNTCVISIGNSDIEDSLNSLKGIAKTDYLDLVKVPPNKIHEMGRIVDRFNGVKTYILLGSNLDLENLNRTVPPVAAVHQITNISNLIEEEFGVVDLDAVIWRHWWDVPSALRSGGGVVIKRFLDLLIVTIFALPATLVVLFASIAIKMDSRGPVFYKQIRLGRFRVPFNILKLRSMDLSAEAAGVQWAKIGDTRVTRVGRFLRKTRIDELPQLWNILKGEMSFIGPRPERPEFYDLIEKKLPIFGVRLCCKPGLSGWAQISYPYGASFEDAKNKLRYDLYYIKNASLKLDLQICFRTFVAMVRGAR